MNHLLQENGVVPTVAQHLMRHSIVNLTTKTYISSASLLLAEAIKRVPAVRRGHENRDPTGLHRLKALICQAVEGGATTATEILERIEPHLRPKHSSKPVVTDDP